MLPCHSKLLSSVLIGAILGVGLPSGAMACADKACTVHATVVLMRQGPYDLKDSVEFQVAGQNNQNAAVMPPISASLNMATKHFEGVVPDPVESFVVSILTSGAYATSLRRYYVNPTATERTKIQLKVAPRDTVFNEDMDRVDRLDPEAAAELLTRMIKSLLPQSTGQAFRARKRLAETYFKLDKFPETRQQLVEIFTRLRVQDLSEAQRNAVFSVWLSSFFEQLNYMSLGGTPELRFSRKLCEPENDGIFKEWQDFAATAALQPDNGNAAPTNCTPTIIAQQVGDARKRFHQAPAS
jgi:hypothetical protein